MYEFLLFQAFKYFWDYYLISHAHIFCWIGSRFQSCWELAKLILWHLQYADHEWKRVSVSIKQHYTLECYPKLSHDFNRSLQMKLYVMRYVLPTNFNGERDYDVVSIAFVKPTSLRSWYQKWPSINFEVANETLG